MLRPEEAKLQSLKPVVAAVEQNIFMVPGTTAGLISTAPDLCQDALSSGMLVAIYLFNDCHLRGCRCPDPNAVWTSYSQLHVTCQICLLLIYLSMVLSSLITVYLISSNAQTVVHVSRCSCSSESAGLTILVASTQLYSILFVFLF